MSSSDELRDVSLLPVTRLHTLPLSSREVNVISIVNSQTKSERNEKQMTRSGLPGYRQFKQFPFHRRVQTDSDGLQSSN